MAFTPPIHDKEKMSKDVNGNIYQEFSRKIQPQVCKKFRESGIKNFRGSGIKNFVKLFLRRRESAEIKFF